ncbi:MAG: class I SAM-dependent methyltransferase [Nocardioidaceae bacterium]
MSTGYKLAYRFGVTPWEAAGETGIGQLNSLLDREETDRAAPYRKALDLGCGRGTHSIALTKRGWHTTGVDVIAQAISAARQRAASEQVDVDFVQTDVTALSAAEIGDGFTFLLDVGCFHGLREAQRQAMGDGVNAVATADATMLVLAFRPGRRGPVPRGASREDLERAFLGWHYVDQTAAETAGMPGPLKKTAPQWYRLQRG